MCKKFKTQRFRGVMRFCFPTVGTSFAPLFYALLLWNPFSSRAQTQNYISHVLYTRLTRISLRKRCYIRINSLSFMQIFLKSCITWRIILWSSRFEAWVTCILHSPQWSLILLLHATKLFHFRAHNTSIYRYSAWNPRRYSQGRGKMTNESMLSGHISARSYF